MAQEPAALQKGPAYTIHTCFTLNHTTSSCIHALSIQLVGRMNLILDHLSKSWSRFLELKITCIHYFCLFYALLRNILFLDTVRPRLLAFMQYMQVPAAIAA